MKCFKKWFGTSVTRRCVAAALWSSVVLTACGGVTEEQMAARENAIAMIENGDYEGAVAALNGLVEAATSVTEFELDILKYRAEAEFQLEDYAAAVHTYRTLMEVDKELPEYCYFSALALARDGKTDEAVELLERGKALDKELSAAGLFEATMALAEAYEADGMAEMAKEIYYELIAGGYGDTNMYNRLVMMAMDEEDYSGALELVAKGLALTDGLAMQELKFNEAVCYEFLGDFAKALELFRAYAAEYGSDDRVAHEIAFLETR